MIGTWTVAVNGWLALMLAMLALIGVGFLVLESMYRMIDRRDRKAQADARARDRSR